MKRDMNLVLLDHRGTKFTDGMTLGKAVEQALQTTLQEDARQAVEERMKLYRLLQKVAAGGVQEFTADELALVKHRAVQSGFTLAGFGALSDALDKDFVAEVVQITGDAA